MDYGDYLKSSQAVPFNQTPISSVGVTPERQFQSLRSQPNQTKQGLVYSGIGLPQEGLELSQFLHGPGITVYHLPGGAELGQRGFEDWGDPGEQFRVC